MKAPTAVTLLLCLTAAVLGGCARQSAVSPPVPAASALPGPASASSPSGGPGGSLVVGVPCGLAMAYKEAKTQFLHDNPNVKLVPRVKNVGPMMREVRDGKVKMDVFLSLGEEEIAILTKAGKVQAKPTPFLRQAMQLIVQKGNPLGVKSLEDLARPEVKTVAMCVPERTLGTAAEKALRTAGVWDQLKQEDKLVLLDQPIQTKELVFTRKVDAAFIYGACSTESFAAADPERAVAGKADVVMTVPEESYGGMFAVAAIISDAPNPDLAARFVQALLAPPTQQAMARLGYGMVAATP